MGATTEGTRGLTGGESQFSAVIFKYFADMSHAEVHLWGLDELYTSYPYLGPRRSFLIYCTTCSGRGVPRLAGGAAPQLWTAHPRGGPKISRSGPARE